MNIYDNFHSCLVLEVSMIRHVMHKCVCMHIFMPLCFMLWLFRFAVHLAGALYLAASRCFQDYMTERRN